MRSITPEKIDAVLPQTQCGLCGHGGCMPYAESMVYENEAIDLCPPGGIPVLRELASLLNKDSASLEENMQRKAKPPLLAVIREDECIGCTKCINVCPVDAIIGSAKSMHSIISTECTGCELCIPACPVDCIDLIPEINTNKSPQHFRERFQAREARIAQEKREQDLLKRQQANHDRAAFLQDALLRAQNKKQIKE